MSLLAIARAVTRRNTPDDLDPVKPTADSYADDLTGATNPDFLALGLGGTNMMAMLWSIAMGRRAVGVELRGDPALGVHWNIREDFYHHLGLIDQLMMQRYGIDRIPRQDDGKLLLLAEAFYSTETVAGGYYTDEILTGFLRSLEEDAHISGLIYHTEFIDDRWVNGQPQRVITVLDPPRPPTQHDPSKIGRPIFDVLDGPSTFQVAAAESLVLLRRYLEKLEEMDLAAGVEPRVRLFVSHRVVTHGEVSTDQSYLRWFKQDEGFVTLPDGRKRIRIERVRELDYKGKFRRVRVPGTKVMDLGVPEVFMIAEGFDSSDAERLGFRQEDVEVDHHDGRGPVVAQADYLAGLLEIKVNGRLRRRIASEFDKNGNEYWVRQIAVGHEDDPEVGWILVQVPDYKTFDPILAGLVPPGTDRKSKRYLGAYQHMLREYYLEQVALIIEIPKPELEKIQMPYGPKLFSLVERVGADALVAANGVVAGDSFGNGHFLTSGGAITGMVGHASRVLEYWRARAAGVQPPAAVRRLADAIKEDTDGWLQVSAQEFSQAVPINFGADRIAQIERATGQDSSLRANTIDATRRHRHSLVPLNPSDWRRLVVTSGRLHTHDLPPMQDTHPLLRGQMPAAAINGAPMNGMPAHGMPPNGMPMHDMPAAAMNGAPMHSMPAHGAPPNGMPMHDMPAAMNGAPMHSMPAHGAPPNGMPMHDVPMNGMPGGPMHGMPAHGMPMHGAPAVGGVDADTADDRSMGMPRWSEEVAQTVGVRP